MNVWAILFKQIVIYYVSAMQKEALFKYYNNIIYLFI